MRFYKYFIFGQLYFYVIFFVAIIANHFTHILSWLRGQIGIDSTFPQ